MDRRSNFLVRFANLSPIYFPQIILKKKSFVFNWWRKLYDDVSWLLNMFSFVLCVVLVLAHPTHARVGSQEMIVKPISQFVYKLTCRAALCFTHIYNFILILYLFHFYENNYCLINILTFVLCRRNIFFKINSN